MNRLKDDQVDLWVEIAPESALAPDLSDLSEDEVSRMNRFIRPEDGVRFAHAHVTLRRLLAAYTSLAPRELIFEIGDHGKPHLSNVDGLFFNLSHTREGFALAVAKQPVGVDIERSDRRTDFELIADRYFGETEWPPPSGDPDERRLHFFDLWALKEAYIKARGLGLKLPLKSFAFLGAYPELIASLDAEGQTMGPWTFWSTRNAAFHIAVASPAVVSIAQKPAASDPIS